MYNTNKERAQQSVTWKQFTGKGYSTFQSLKRQVCIGVLSVATLGIAAKAEAAIGMQMYQPQEDEDDEKEAVMDEVTVSGTMAPLTQLQSARIVNVLSLKEIEQAGVQSINDLFKLASGVDVRQRGGYGIQTDIGIDGGIFDQITILLNGVNINNPQTGHLVADFPVSISDIDHIEVLEGATSRVYGGQSFGGAINIVTKKPTQDSDKWSAEAGAKGGSYGTVEADARIGLKLKNVWNSISGNGGRSDGGTKNSEWKKGQLFYQGGLDNNTLQLNWQFGFSRKSYGANTFYSAAYPNQYERNERYIVSVSGETKGKFHFTPQVYWNRSYDNFELIRNSTTGENFHQADVYGIKAGGYFNWWAGKTAVGAELREEGILSTNLGRDMDASQYKEVHFEKGIYYTQQDDRTSVNFNIEHNILLQRWTISAGVLANMTTSVDHKMRLYPGVDVSYRPAAEWKLYLSYNKGFRMPTFTELYYKSPTHEGNKGLKPEHNHSLQLGIQWHKNGLSTSARGFYHRGTNIIDWVMYDQNDSYHSSSFDLDNLGVQVESKVDFPKLCRRQTWIENLSLGYTYIHQIRHDDKPFYKSNYAMEYLRHKLVGSLHHRIVSNLSATWSVRWQDRMGGYIKNGVQTAYKPYATLDVKMQWTQSHYMLFAEATNITNHHYYDLGNVEQPGIWVMGGIRWKL